MGTETSNARGEWVLVPREVFDFLMGEGELQGAWFGETPAGERGEWFWRKHLRQAETAPPPADARGDVRGLVDVVSDLRHSAVVDDYEIDQIAFLNSIADRIEAALAAEGVRSGEASAVVCLVTGKLYPHFAEVQVQLYGGYEPKNGDQLYTAPPSAPVGVDAPGSRAWMAEVCRAAALSLAAHGVRNDQLSKVADWIAQQPAAVAVDACEHEWVSADNRYVQNASTCLKCRAIVATSDLATQHQEPKS